MKFNTAMKHRKLFPDENSTYAPQTADCTFCDPGCPPDTCIPIFFPPPPPSSPPPPPPPHNHPVSPYLIIFVCLVIGFLLVILFNVIRAKVRQVNQAPANNNGPQQQAPSDGSEEEELVDQRNHHIWFISTVGLQSSVINSISVCKYKRGEGLIEGTECSVCLNEFQEDETLRLLPKCSHAFHISCIDTWLKSHTNCPMCRARIVSSSESSPPPTAAAQNPDISAVMANTQIRNPENESRVGENRERNGENREGTGEGGGAERIFKQSVSSTPLMTRYVSFDSSMAESADFSVEDCEKPSTSRQQTGGGGGCSSVVLQSVCVKAQSP